MTPYNTQLLPLKLPEYGRHIHQMIDYCVSIPDREERTEYAYTVAHIMERFFPELVTGIDGEKKVWDHINIMSGFALDIDFPCEVTRPEDIHPRPDKISHTGPRIRHRHYGRTIQQMIERVAAMEQGEEKEALVSMIAHHMKKLMLMHNPEGADDARILRDLADFSGGSIVLDPDTYVLRQFNDIQKEQQPSRKKKK